MSISYKSFRLRIPRKRRINNLAAFVRIWISLEDTLDSLSISVQGRPANPLFLRASVANDMSKNKARVWKRGPKSNKT